MMMVNPVLQRELIEFLRSRRAFAILGAYLVILTSVIIMAWPSSGRLALHAPIARAIYDIFARGQFVLIVLLAPVLSAPAIAGEHERRTADLLFTSPLSPLAIAAGKLLSAMVYLILLAVASLPMFSCCLFLGGVGEREIGATFIFLFLAGLFSASLGLATSAYLPRSRSALTLCYALLLPPALLFLFINPFRSLLAASLLGVPALAAVGVLFLLACRRLRRSGRQSAPAIATAEEDAFGLVLDRRRFPDRFFLPLAPGEPFTAGSRALLEKEIRHEGLGRDTFVLRLILQLTMLASLPFFLAAIWGAALWIYAFYLLAFVMVIVPPLAAGAFSAEREAGTLDLLLSTPLRNRDLILAKIFGRLRHFLAVSAPLLPFFVFLGPLMAISGKMRLDSDIAAWLAIPIGALAVLAAATALALFISLLTSLVCRTTLRSMMVAYLSLIVVYLVPAIAYLALTRLADCDPRTVMWLGGFSPFFVVAAMEAEGSDLLASFFLPGAGTLLLAFHLALMAGGCAVLLGCLFWGFDRYCRLRR